MVAQPRSRSARRVVVVVAVVAAVLFALRLLPRAGEPQPAATEGPARAASQPREVPVRQRARTTPNSEPPPAETAEAPPPADAGQRVLHVSDPSGSPISGVHVTGPGGPRLTDAQGEAAFTAGDGPPAVRFFDGDAERTVELRDPVTRVTIGRFPVLVVDAVDGSTGAPLALPRVRIPSGNGERVVTSEQGLPLALLSNGRAVVIARVDPPPGFGGLVSYTFTGPVAAKAATARWTLPLFPARELLFAAVDAEGHALEGVRVVEATTPLPGSRYPDDVAFTSAPSGPDGIVRMTGVPRLPFARLHVRLARPIEDETRTEMSGNVEGIRLDGADATQPQTVVLRARPIVGQGFSPRNGAGVGASTHFDRSAPLTVRVYQRDGRPAARVTVAGTGFSATTGPDGVVRFAAAPTGSQTLRVFAHGFAPTIATVEVGTESEVVVHEGESRTVQVLVVDEEGRALPAAQVSASCVDVAGPDGRPIAIDCSIAQVDGGCEWLTPLTNRDGIVALTVPRGTVDFRAVLGGAEGHERTDADSVRIVLRAPE